MYADANGKTAVKTYNESQDLVYVRKELTRPRKRSAFMIRTDMTQLPAHIDLGAVLYACVSLTREPLTILLITHARNTASITCTPTQFVYCTGYYILP